MMAAERGGSTASLAASARARPPAHADDDDVDAAEWADAPVSSDMFDMDDLDADEAAIITELKDAEAAWLAANEARRMAEAERVKADAALAAARAAMAAAVAAEKGYGDGQLGPPAGGAAGVGGRGGGVEGVDAHAVPRGGQGREKKRKEPSPGTEGGGRRAHHSGGGGRGDTAGIGRAGRWDSGNQVATGHSEPGKRAKSASESAEQEDGGRSEGSAPCTSAERPRRPMRHVVDEDFESTEEELATDAERSAYDSDAQHDNRRGEGTDFDAEGGSATDEDVDGDTACDAAASAARADRPAFAAVVDDATDAEADDTADSSDDAAQPDACNPSEMKNEGAAALPASTSRAAAAAFEGVRRPRKKLSMRVASVRGSSPTTGGGAASAAAVLENRGDVTRKGRAASPPPSEQDTVVAPAAATEAAAAVPNLMSSGRRARAARRAAAAATAAAVAGVAASDAATPSPPGIASGFRLPKRTLEDVAAAVADEKDEPLVEPTSPLSLLEATKYVLRREGRPMSIKAVVETALSEGIWKSNCKTPKSSLASLLSIQRTKVRTGQITSTFFTQTKRTGDNLVYDPKGLG